MKYLPLLSVFLLLILNSCFTGVPLKHEKAQNNQTYQVEYLFAHDGCKVYRFYDMGHYVYFTNCQGEAVSIESDSVSTRINNQINISSLK